MSDYRFPDILEEGWKLAIETGRVENTPAERRAYYCGVASLFAILETTAHVSDEMCFAILTETNDRAKAALATAFGDSNNPNKERKEIH